MFPPTVPFGLVMLLNGIHLGNFDSKPCFKFNTMASPNRPLDLNQTRNTKHIWS